MAFSKKIQEDALVACGRCCCICHNFCGTKMELHHIRQKAYDGADTFENCIPLCFSCHADMGKADPNHVKGKRYSEEELKRHRDNWYKKVANFEIAPISNEEIDEIFGMDNNFEKSVINSDNKVNISILDTTQRSNYSNNALKGTFKFDYSNNNGEYTIGEGVYTFITKWSKASDKSIHAYKDAKGIKEIALLKGCVDLNNIKEIECDFSSRCRTPNIGEAIVWKNVNDKYAITKIISIKDNSRNATKDELECEYIIF